MADWPAAQGDGQHVASTTHASLATYGTQLTAGSANVKGAWVEGLAALPFDAAGFLFQTVNDNANANYLFDMGIGGSGQEVVLLPNYLISPPTSAYAGSSAYFPVFVKRGTRISFRCQSDTGAATAAASALFVAAGFAHGSSFGRITTYGVADSGTTDSTSVDPGGVTNTKGSWVTLTNASAIANPIKHAILNFQTNNTAATSCLWKVDIGIGATPTIVVPDLIIRAHTNTDQVIQPTFSFPLRVPAGVALKARASCSITDGTDRLLNELSILGID